MDFLRFSDKRPLRLMGWQHRDLPPIPDAHTPRLMSRLPKLCPHKVLPDHDIAVWIDSSVEVTGDITPLIRRFAESGADIAFFAHPSGRSVAEELDFALKGRIGPEFHEAAERQRQRYADAGLLDHKVVEASIIFYRLSSEALREAGEAWWHELTHYTERDQVSQPYAMRDERLRIHLWDWHFKQENPYFRRLPHRPGSLVKRLQAGARFLGDSRLDYRLVRYAIRSAGSVRRAGLSLLSRQ
ncbi:DUF616 domain-containing protein [Roseibacterium sp. SDUM158017]|uniref:glycosyltransferase domain-containing protein n=1 Tax=Roseicyclus salinarum TaxID=3036773 RepID=UPI002414FF7B|nr:glycosyltransferase domain-containing protein [Roseibacterium sp. SDUM158017]MDG4649644.1 DUF616 domain-containing protein [Roseibacterium sp. SDUM158017]